MYSYDPERGDTVWSHDFFAAVEVVDYVDDDVTGENVLVELPNGKLQIVHVDTLCPMQEEWETWTM